MCGTRSDVFHCRWILLGEVEVKLGQVVGSDEWAFWVEWTDAWKFSSRTRAQRCSESITAENVHPAVRFDRVDCGAKRRVAHLLSFTLRIHLSAGETVLTLHLSARNEIFISRKWMSHWLIYRLPDFDRTWSDLNTKFHTKLTGQFYVNHGRKVVWKWKSL